MIMILIVGVLLISNIFFLMKYIQAGRMGMRTIMSAKKKGQPVLFLETPNSYLMRTVTAQEDNLIFTKERDIIPITPGTQKPCAQLGGVSIVHGDFYGAMTYPTDLYHYIEHLKREGKDADEIAEIIDKIANADASTIDKELIPVELKSDSIKYSFFKPVSFDSIRNFLNTGFNRTLQKRQMQLLLREDNILKKLFGGGRNWIQIAIAIVIIAIGIGIFLQFASSSGFLDAIIPSSAPAILPTTN